MFQAFLLIRNLKKNKFLRIIYRELYYFSRKISVIVFSFLIKRCGLQTLTRNDLTNQPQQYNLIYFNPEELIKFGDFYTLTPNQELIVKQVSIFTEKIVKPFVCEIDYAKVIGLPPVAFTQDGKLILETTLPHFSPITSHIAKNVSIKTLILYLLSSKNADYSYCEVACLLFNPWSSNYWHWTVDILTQLEAIEYYQHKTGIKPKLIVEPHLRTWQKESLKLLGYNSEDLIPWQNQTTIVKKLIVPSFRRSYDEIKFHGEISVTACRWLRTHILNNLSDISEPNHFVTTKIFISRRQALGRRVINEFEVMNFLSNLGFKSYVLEEMNYSEQVKLFAQAEIIIAPHGAGLTNLIFADNPIIIELFSTYLGREFVNLARGLGFKYGCLHCQSPRGEVRQKDGDMIVDIMQLNTLLTLMQT